MSILNPRQKRSYSPKPQPTCNALIKWLRLNLGPHSLGALTGTDTRALKAAVHILEMWVHGGDDDLLEAFRVVVLKMQPSTREFAYHAVAFLREWDDRGRVWYLAGLPVLEHVQRCEGER